MALRIPARRYTKIIREARIFINTKKFPALKLSAFYKIQNVLFLGLKRIAIFFSLILC